MKINLKAFVIVFVGLFGLDKVQAMDRLGAEWEDICSIDVRKYDDPGYSEQEFHEQYGILKNGHLLPVDFKIPVDEIPKKAELDQASARHRAVNQKLIAAASRLGINIPKHISAHFGL